ncbi:hypothetical protein PQ460_14020 [Paenibacillus sp. KACC 21273]|uniref:hypothetical protein n=1 Tax=Paenibacillus sp. KACC 21273 TaxID=3025665 RepID=UPI00236662B5|nr:hypothetical protein [Paenibacillus sp. KACC 21273]WDF49129.1 hypothetical protein PQ460_14020 [Paenibacillus sp. KACC 21273]
MIRIYNKELDKLAEIHYKAIKDQLYKDFKQIKGTKKISTDEIEIKFNEKLKKNGINNTLREIITSKFDQLTKIAKRNIKYKKDTTFQKMYNKFSNGKDAHIGLRKPRGEPRLTYNANTMVESLGFKVCPLCNRNYINNTKRIYKTGKNGVEYTIKRTCQLDHYYSQSEYPLLAMSFYNLIPVCSSCNHAKSDKSLSISPYSIAKVDHLITFDFNIDDVKAISDKNHVKVSIKVDSSNKKVIKDHLDIIGIEELYKNHNDIVFEILQKYRHYNHIKRKELIVSFPGLYENEQEIKNVLFGEYKDIDNFHRKSLSKLTRDIIKRIDNYPSDLI